MNKRQKEVLKTSLNDEKKILEWLKQTYSQASKDTAQKIAELSARKDMENLQSIIYQKKYQEALLKQIESTLETLQSASFDGINDYLKQCYENGYIGAMYDFHGQGIPIIMPIDQKQVKKALEIDSKLSQGLYNRLGEEVDFLKLKIKAEVSRGIVNGSTWNEVAEKIAKGMNSPFNVAKNNSMRIARTEGHRVQMQSQMDACREAKKKGADIVKQWDSTMDNRTRPSHRQVDGEIRELEESFSNGLQMPSDPLGHAAEVINCRCCLLQRAKWALDEDELATLEERAEFFGLDKSDDFEEFKEKYLNLPQNSDIIELKPKRTKNEISDKLGRLGIEYNQITPHKTIMTEEDIINVLAGSDKTKGSCASVGLAYCGQRCGYDVLDFRDGESRKWFAGKYNKVDLWEKLGIKYTKEDSYKTSIANGNKILKSVEIGKEYYLSVGGHASIVRKTNEGVLQYLELQAETVGSIYKAGWNDFHSDPRTTLKYRFGCSSSTRYVGTAYMTCIDDMKGNDAFLDVLGYINTSVGKEVKGIGGTIK